MLKILGLLCVLGHHLLVSGTPVLIPIQACPHSCAQNPYPNYQNPTNVPLIVQTPIQHMPPNMIPSNNNQHYNQGYMIQNQMPPAQNQASDPMVNQLNQMYMNKIMSNPNLQTILDPNTLFSQLGIEMPNQYNGNGNNPNGNPPQVINNYFILPSEFFENSEKNEKRRQNPENRERENNRRGQNSPNDRRSPNVMEMVPPEYRRKQQRDRNPGPNTRREHQRMPYHHERADRMYSGEERGRNNRRRPDERHANFDRERNMRTSISPSSPPPLPPSHARREQHNDKQRQHNSQEMQKQEKIITTTESPKVTYHDTPKTTSLEKSLESTTRIPKKKNKKSRDDAIIEDFHHKFPGMPEEVVRKLLSYLKRQLQNQQLGNNPFNHHDFNHRLRYDQHSHQNVHENRRNPNKKNGNRKSIESNNTKPSTVETTTNTEPMTTTFQTTESVNLAPTVKEKKKLIKETEKEIITLTPESKERVEVVETTTSYTVPETVTEDGVLDISKRIVADYYPQFINDKYYGSDEVYNVRNLRDNRYHYTTDRNYEPNHSIHDFNKYKLRNLHKSFEDSFEDAITRPDTEENTSFNSDSDSELVFRTPPFLEDPDFRTKQIIKRKPDYLNEVEKQVSYKSSTYSDAKSLPNRDVKNHKVNNKKNKPDIETVYAHSKVVKYGKSNDESSENVTPVVTYYLPDNMQYEEDGKTVIIAKSIPPDHFW